MSRRREVDEAANGFGRCGSHCAILNEFIACITKVVLGGLLAFFAKTSIQVVDQAPVADGSRTIDKDCLGSHGRSHHLGNFV